MAVKGAIAKNKVTQIIANAFGNDFIGEFDKKLYVWADDGGSRVQISLALTVPKNLKGPDVTIPTSAFPEEKSVSEPKNEISKEEQDTLAALMEKLHLN